MRRAAQPLHDAERTDLSAASPLPRATPLALLLLLTAGMLLLYGQVPYQQESFASWDLASYRRIAAAAPGLASDVCQPFAFRLLGPYLLGLLPLPDPLAFRLASVLGAFVLVVLFHRFLCAEGLRPATAACAVALFLFNRYWFGYTVWNPFQINDLLSLIALVVLFGALRAGRWGLFGLTLLLGVLARETSLLMVPVAVAFLHERGQLARRWRPLVLALLPGLVAAVALRALVPVPCGDSLPAAFVAFAGKVFEPGVLARLLVNATLPLTLLPLIQPSATRHYFAARKHQFLYLILVFVSTLFGYNNERLMAPAFLVFYGLIGAILEAGMWRRTSLVLLLGGGFLASLHHTFAWHPLPDQRWTIALSALALLLVSGVALAERGRSRLLQA